MRYVVSHAVYIPRTIHSPYSNACDDEPVKEITPSGGWRGHQESSGGMLYGTPIDSIYPVYTSSSQVRKQQDIWRCASCASSDQGSIHLADDDAGRIHHQCLRAYTRSGFLRTARTRTSIRTFITRNYRVIASSRTEVCREFWQRHSGTHNTQAIVA